MRPDGYQHMTIARGIRCAAVRNPHQLALAMDDTSLTYGQLVRRINKVAALGQSYGLSDGDRVALVAPNCLDYVELVAGFSELGVIVATLSPRLSRTELHDILDDCIPALIIAHPSCKALVDPDWERDTRILWLGEIYEAALARASDAAFISTVNEEAPFALAYTSGTTGRPKGVLLSHRSRALTFAAMAAEYRCFGAEDNFLALSPMCHGAGFVFACAALHFGGTTTLFSSQDPEAILHRIGQQDVSGIFIVPTHFARLFDLPSATLDRHRHHGLRTIISNAAALPQTMKEAAIHHFGHGLLNETYGSTEGGIVTNIAPQYLLEKPGSVGLPFPHMEIELRLNDGTVASAGIPGELFCRGPTLFNGYWNHPAATAETMIDGWVTVGDMAVRDEDGFISIIDRKKDMVITGGINVYPKEIELIIGQVPGVKESAVVGEPSKEWGESLHAFVVRSNGLDVTADAVIAACKKGLAGYKVPKTVSFVAELPRNAGGKILKAELRDRITA